MLSLEAMTYHRRVWFNAGLWHEPNQPRWYFWYTLCLIVFIYVLFPVSIATKLFFIQSIDELTDILRVLPSTAFGLKAAFIAKNRIKIVQLIEYLKQMDDFVQQPRHQDMIRQQVKESKNLVLYFSYDYYLSVSAYFIVAVLSGTDLMFLAWYPVDYANSIVWYYSINIYQYISTLFIAYVFTTLDFYGIVLYKLLGSHLDVLVLQLAEIGHIERNLLQVDSVARESGECLKTNEEELKRCIKYHSLCSRFVHPEYINISIGILYGLFCRFANLLNQIISSQYVLQFGFSISIVCCSEFQLVSVLYEKIYFFL